MLLYSGRSARCSKMGCITHVPYSTQATLDEGVQKIRKIYETYEQVGIKDRSMIWNS